MLCIQCGCHNPNIGGLAKHKQDKDKELERDLALARERLIRNAIIHQDTENLKNLIKGFKALPSHTEESYLILATQHNYLAGVQLLLQKLKIEDINAQDDQGYTALHWAAEQGATKIVQALLDTEKANIYIQGGDSKSIPLMIAAKHSDPHIVNRLIAFDPSPQHINAQDAMGDTALILAIMNRDHKVKLGNKLAIVNILLEKGADITKSNAKNRTALQSAQQRIRIDTLSAKSEYTAAKEVAIKKQRIQEMQTIAEALEKASKSTKA